MTDKPTAHKIVQEILDSRQKAEYDYNVVSDIAKLEEN